MNAYFTKLSRDLRNNPTDAEKLLWRHLSRKQLENTKFRRQQPIGNYIVDFVSFEKKIIVELDGGQHDVKINRDKTRDEWLENQGFKVLRFWNNEVFSNTTGVLEVIRENILSHPPLSPPIKGGETSQ